MALPAESKAPLVALLFGWPVAAGVGWFFARVTHTDWPAALFPVAWLGVLFVALRRYASSESR